MAGSVLDSRPSRARFCSRAVSVLACAHSNAWPDLGDGGKGGGEDAAAGRGMAKPRYSIWVRKISTTAVASVCVLAGSACGGRVGSIDNGRQEAGTASGCLLSSDSSCIDGGDVS